MYNLKGKRKDALHFFNRPIGCTLNGYDAAAFECPGALASANDTAKPSVLSVVDPKTWKVLDWVQASQNLSNDRGATHLASRRGKRVVILITVLSSSAVTIPSINVSAIVRITISTVSIVRAGWRIVASVRRDVGVAVILTIR